MDKLQVYFNEYNVLMNNAVYLPLVSGQLQAYSQTFQEINNNYQFMQPIFFRDNVERILSQYNNPAVVAFSTSMWNFNLSLEVAKKIKEKFPKCLIIFGGPHVPFQTQKFFKEYPFIDVTIRGEGEKTFAEILLRNLQSRDFGGIKGISYKDSPGNVRIMPERELEPNLDIYPSPYLTGIFDNLMGSSKINFQAIIETNRGCPFLCSYCFWGQGGLSKKFRFFSLDRIKKVADWAGRNKIKYVFCADSNFGMFERDLEIAQYFVDAKKKYNFPEKFRVCYGKNAEENIFKTGKLLASQGMEKGMTLSKQTDNTQALTNIRRINISNEVFNSLQRRYNKQNIPVYTELILGLPGETYQSFKDGVETVLQSGIKNQLFVYRCQVYPNTELASEVYQKKFNIEVTKVPLTEVHGAVRSSDLVTEYEDIVTATGSMPRQDWKKSIIFGLVMQLFHGLKVGFHITNYLVDKYNIKHTDFFEYIAQQKNGILGQEINSFNQAIDFVLKGKPFCVYLPDFGNVYWDQEEASFLNISNNREQFYKELFEITKEFLKLNNKQFGEEELREVIRYQEIRIPDYKPLSEKEFHFKYNIPEYFATFHTNKVGLLKKPQLMTLEDTRDYNNDKETFAKERILWGRKSDRILRNVKWLPAN